MHTVLIRFEGSVAPQGQVEQFVLNYFDGRGAFIQLAHFIPFPSEGAEPDVAPTK